jgi:hypothetical protein
MTNHGRYAITYTGNGIVRLPRAGIFQTGTRAVVDETIARIAVAHGTFRVVPIDAATPMTLPVEATPAPAVVATVAAAPAVVAVAAATAATAAPPVDDKGRRPTRRSAAIRAVRS